MYGYTYTHTQALDSELAELNLTQIITCIENELWFLLWIKRVTSIWQTSYTNNTSRVWEIISVVRWNTIKQRLYTVSSVHIW